MAVMRVKPWGEGQGEFVNIEEADFDPSFHVPFDAPATPKAADPFDHDGDGKPGGSKKRNPRKKA